MVANKGLAARDPAMKSNWMSGIGWSGLLLTKAVMPPGNSVAIPVPQRSPLPNESRSRSARMVRRNGLSSRRP